MRVDHHNFYSEDGSREAIVFHLDGAWYVDLLEGSVGALQLVETRKMETDGVLHSERYAEDCAENWVLHVF
jgi:hypothetical protein|tara:strand:+ start:2751 stop:2963 length:213 start_codon:yes stop_codon:yes gene_type:complete